MDIISRDEAYNQGRRHYYTGKACKRGHLAERFVANGGCVMCLNRRMGGIPKDGLAFNQFMPPSPLAFPSADEAKLTPEMLSWVWGHRVLPNCAAWMEEYWQGVAAGTIAGPRRHATRAEAQAAQDAVYGDQRPDTAPVLPRASKAQRLFEARRDAEERIVLGPKAGDATLAVFLGAGWTPEQLVQAGYASWK